MAKQKKKGDDDWFSWAVIVFLFVINLWPIALILLLAKLFGKDGKKPALPDNKPEPASQPSRARTAAQRMTRTPLPK